MNNIRYTANLTVRIIQKIYRIAHPIQVEAFFISPQQHPAADLIWETQ